jgi:hypothetical protein
MSPVFVDAEVKATDVLGADVGVVSTALCMTQSTQYLT